MRAVKHEAITALLLALEGRGLRLARANQLWLPEGGGRGRGEGGGSPAAAGQGAVGAVT
jgi:hypothetical protein